jgi:hypothetical protein
MASRSRVAPASSDNPEYLINCVRFAVSLRRAESSSPRTGPDVPLAVLLTILAMSSARWLSPKAETAERGFNGLFIFS